MASETTRATSGATLSPIAQMRTQATVDGRDAVVVRFGPGARLSYVECEDAVREEWIAPEATASTWTPDHEEPLRTVALSTVGEYLSFDDRPPVSFVWGEANLAVVAP